MYVLLCSEELMKPLNHNNILHLSHNTGIGTCWTISWPVDIVKVIRSRTSLTFTLSIIMTDISQWPCLELYLVNSLWFVTVSSIAFLGLFRLWYWKDIMSSYMNLRTCRGRVKRTLKGRAKPRKPPENTSSRCKVCGHAPPNDTDVGMIFKNMYADK